MKTFTLLMLSFLASICKAEPKVEVYYEQSENGYAMYADNREYCSVSIKIDFVTTNLEVSKGNSNIYVVPPLSTKQLLTKLSVTKKGEAYKFSYQYWFNYGDENKTEYDSMFNYYLPFTQSKAFEVYQGYNGTFTHQNENALDFTMPIGTEICAIREGVVVSVIEKNTENCGTEECEKYNNLIMICHPDGTFAEYVHIKHNGSIVNVGDEVTQGQIIGYSGNVGWSTGPHLHLVVFKQKINSRETLQTRFLTRKGDRTEYLVERRTYRRNY